MFVSLKVFDALDREVASPVDGVRNAGLHSVYFDASHLGAGTYLLSPKVAAGALRATQARSNSNTQDY